MVGGYNVRYNTAATTGSILMVGGEFGMTVSELRFFYWIGIWTSNN